MNKNDLRQKITRAREEITIAEGELDEVLRVMEVSSTREKVNISDVLRDAFGKLKDAMGSLAELEAALLKED
jgi:hypothetical protein